MSKKHHKPDTPKLNKPLTPDHAAQPAAPAADHLPPLVSANGSKLIASGSQAIRQTQILQLQQQLGNDHVQRVIAQHTAPHIQRQDDSPADTAAQAIYDALDGWNNEAQALSQLRGQSASSRQQIDAAFRSRYHKGLRQYFREQLGGDWLVKAYAVLKDGNEHGYHTAVALALIPSGTRDEELNRILFSLPLAGRQAMERKYNETFGIPSGSYWISRGNLKLDLIDDLSGWRLEKMSALLDRDLTMADKIYFDSEGITGTHDDSLIRNLQQTWEQGPAAFANLERDWNRYIKSTEGWSATHKPTRPWTERTLRQSMSSELSGESWQIVRAILDGYDATKRLATQGQNGAFTARTNLSDTQQHQLEESQLTVARQTLTAATTGGITGWGTNVPQVFHAIQQIRQIWERRIARARSGNNNEQLTRYQNQWNQERTRITQMLPSEMDTGTADWTQARLTLLGNLNLADKFYIAGEIDVNFDKALGIVDKAWQQGKIGELRQQAGQERRDPNDSNRVLRPVFSPGLVISPVSSSSHYYRYYPLVRPDRDGAAQSGAERLKYELEQGDDESDLAKAHKFLKDAPATLRDQTISAFVASWGQSLMSPYRSRLTGSAKRKFVTFVHLRYQASHSCWAFSNLLLPTQNPAEIARRARMQAQASNTLGTQIYDFFTDEDTVGSMQASANRLNFIAQASDAELRVIMAMAGVTSRQALSQFEARQFQSRLAEVRRIQRTMVEAIATAIEIAVELAITAITGGGALPALLASLGAAVAGMIVREALQGQDYDFFSQQNLNAILMAAATAGIGQAARPIEEMAEEIARLRNLGEAGTAFLRGAMGEGYRQVNTAVLQAAFQNRAPSGEQVLAQAAGILGRSLGAGQAQRLLAQRGNTVRTQLYGNLTQELLGGVTAEGAELARTGAGNLTGTEIAGRFLRRTGIAIRDGMKNTAGSALGARADQRRERRRQQRLDDQEPDARTNSAVVDAQGRIADSDVPAVPSLRNQHHAPIGNPIDGFEAGQAMLRRLANGDRTALQAIGIHGVPPDFDPRVREWGLGLRPDGRYTIVRGDPNGVSWSGRCRRQNIVPVGHSHPYDVRTQLGQPVEVSRMGNLPPTLRNKIFPSASDVVHGGHATDIHDVHTPFVYLGNGRIGDPVPGQNLPGVTFRLVNTREVGTVQRARVFRTHVLLETENGQVLWRGEMWTRHMAHINASVFDLSPPSGFTPSPGQNRP